MSVRAESDLSQKSGGNKYPPFQSWTTNILPSWIVNTEIIFSNVFSLYERPIKREYHPRDVEDFFHRLIYLIAYRVVYIKFWKVQASPNKLAYVVCILH